MGKEVEVDYIEKMWVLRKYTNYKYLLSLITHWKLDGDII